MTMRLPRQDFFKKTREPVVGYMPAFVKRPGRSVEATSGTFTDAEGNINAQDTRELVQRISALSHIASSGQISASADPTGERQEAIRARHEEYVSAFHSRDDRMQISGEVFAEDLWETFNRQGFTPELVARKDVVDGVDNRIPIRRKDVTAFQVVNDGEGIAQVVEQDYIYPKDYYLQCQILVEERELAQAGPDFLDQKFQDALEAIMVRQDRILRSLFLATAGVFNTPLTFATFSPQVLTALRTQVASNGIPATSLLFSFDLWDDMIADPGFTEWWEPVHKYQLIMEGRIGSLLGMKLITDGFRYQSLKVLEPGEVFALGTPIALGQRGVRREIQATEINHYPLGAPRRGHYFMGVESLHVMDRAVAQGFRA